MQIFNKLKQPNGPMFPWSQRKLNINQNVFPRYGHSINQQAIGNELFLFGGIVRGHPRNDLFAVDINTLNVLPYMTTGEIPSPRSFHTHVNIGKYLLVFGGLTEEQVDDNLYILDTVSNNWSKYLLNGNMGRYGHTSSVIGNKMIIFGGRRNDQYLNDLVIFDVKSISSSGARWEPIIPLNEPPPPRTGHIACYIPAPRHSHCTTIVEDVVYIFGGIGNEGQEKMGPSPNPRFCHTMSAIRDKILVLGGECSLTIKPDEDGIIHILDTSKIKYPPQNQTSGRPPQQSPQNQQISPQQSPQNQQISPQQSLQKQQISPRSIPQNSNGYTQQNQNINYNRQPASPTNQYNNLRNMSSPTNKQVPSKPNGKITYDDDGFYRRQPTYAPDGVLGSPRVIQENLMNNQMQPQRTMSDNSTPSPRMTPDSIGPSSQSPRFAPQSSSPMGMSNNTQAQVNQRGQNYPKRPQIDRSGLPQRMTSDNDINNMHSKNMIRDNTQDHFRYMDNSVSENMRGNTPEQLRYMERDITDSPQPLSPAQVSPSLENLRKENPSPTHPVQPFRDGGDTRARTAGKFEKISTMQIQVLPNNGPTKNFSNPRQAPRPPDTTDQVPSSSSIIYGNDSILSQQSTSPTSFTAESFDTIDHFPTPMSNVERDNFMRELQQRDNQIFAFRKRETWLKAELSLARQEGYTPEADRSSGVPEGLDVEKFMDIGESGSDRHKVMLAVVRLKQELRRTKATIANQAQAASQKITDAERARTAALQEAAYFKAKLTALANASDVELANIEVERAADLEKRLTQALTEKESLQSKLIQYQQSSTYDKSARESAEERSKTATARAEEAEEAHARALAELATLHSRATTAESQLRENNSKITELMTELNQYRSESESTQNQFIQLRQSLEQHKRALEKANHALMAANERTVEAESLWQEARQDVAALEKEAGGLRAELDVKMRDLERAQSRAKELERLLNKAQKEADSVRAMMQEGMTELLSTSRNNEGFSSETAKKITQLEQEIGTLKNSKADSQKVAQDASSSLADAMIKISQMEGAAMKARSDAAALQRRLNEASEDTARTKERLREKERLLEEKIRALEDAEVKVGMMRDVMTEKGILDDGNNNSVSYENFKIHLNKIDSMDSKKNDLNNNNNNDVGSVGSGNITPDITISPDFDGDLKVAKLKAIEYQSELNETKERLHQVETDYQTALHYVKGTEKMLRRMKEELTKSKKEVIKLTEKLNEATKHNEELEEKIAEIENKNSFNNIHKGVRESQLQGLEQQRKEFEQEKELSNERINKLQGLLDNAQEEKTMMDQEYEVLRKEYEALRKESDALRKLDGQLKEKLQNSEEALNNTRAELDQLHSLQNKGNQGIGGEDNRGEDNKGEIIDYQKWQEQKAVLEKELAEFRVVNDKLEKENSELEQKCRESENKITILLDQMEHAVDTYREIEDDIRESSPRNSNVISSLASELDMLKSQWDAHRDQNTNEEELVEPRWSRLPSEQKDEVRVPSRLEEYDEMMAALDEVQKVAAQRKIGQFESVENINNNMTLKSIS
ncbi:7511_t:CDS:10 [Diversispora eburnea]|uniref:7511_t:CDS:1 n=1 Tax=Diversispora eburnea TaxID=1213867 RepID=A0A9N8V0B8_9GLOM|nr:7511_t:CDS:10 [Diversispora eburnea]